MANNNAIQKGLQAAKEAAREEGMAGAVEELGNNLQQNAGGAAMAGAFGANDGGGIAGAGMNADAADVAALGNNVAQGGDAGVANNVADAAATAAVAPAADGFRYDHDDNANR
jgi:hypothetical protein